MICARPPEGANARLAGTAARATGAPTHPARPRAAAGFTLVEVLVALAVVALALGAGMKAAGALTDNAQRLGDVMIAQWCADNRLAEVRLTRSFPGNSETDFSCEQLGRRFNGKLTSVVNTLNTDFSIVDASVTDDRGYRLVRLSTVVWRH